MPARVPPRAEEVHEARKRRRRFFFTTSAGTLFVLLAIGLAWLITRAPFTHIETIALERSATAPSLSGLTMHRLGEEEVREFLTAAVLSQGAFARFLGLASFFSWPEAISPSGPLSPPALRELHLAKEYGERRITVAYEERQPVGAWCFRKVDPARCYWFDEEGVLFRDAYLAEGNLFFTVSDYSQETMKLGSRVLPERLLANFLGVLLVLERSELGVREIRLKDIRLEELEVSTFDGPKLYFSVRHSSAEALPVLQSFLKATGTLGFAAVDYLDFRVEGRAYYR
jgi:hypothetical protein